MFWACITFVYLTSYMDFEKRAAVPTILHFNLDNLKKVHWKYLSFVVTFSV